MTEPGVSFHSALVNVKPVKLGVELTLRVPLDRLKGELTVVIGSVSAKEPLDNVSPEPMAVIGSAKVKVPLETLNPVPRAVTCVVVQP